MSVAKNVTKQTDLVVVADLNSDSGKADKARTYGLPITTTAQFAAGGPGDTVAVRRVRSRRVITCPNCQSTWTVDGRAGAHRSRRCDECAAVRTGPATTGPSAFRESVETLPCADCGQKWTRLIAPGRKPRRCPHCAA